jgi:hypothetical protein
VLCVWYTHTTTHHTTPHTCIVIVYAYLLYYCMSWVCSFNSSIPIQMAMHSIAIPARSVQHHLHRRSTTSAKHHMQRRSTTFGEAPHRTQRRSTTFDGEAPHTFDGEAPHTFDGEAPHSTAKHHIGEAPHRRSTTASMRWGRCTSRPPCWKHRPSSR